MILKILGLEHDLVIEEDLASVVEVTDRKFFQNFIVNISRMIKGEEFEDVITLFDADNPLKIEKEVLMVLDILNLNINDRKIKKDLIPKLQ